MSFENFEDYLTSNLKINDENTFQEKLESLLSKDKNKIDPVQKEKKEQEKILKQRLKDESNEKKIDFILSDETSFEQFKMKNNDIKTIREEKQKEKEKYNEDFYDINSNEKKAINNNFPNETNSIFTNTNNLINEEKDKKDEELMKLGEDIKNNNPLLYNWEKIKKFKEVRDLQAGLEKEEEQKEISVKSKTKAPNNKKSSIKINNNKKINITKKSNNKNIKKDKNINNKLKNKTVAITESQINNKEGDDDDDLIMTTMQCPVTSCEKKNNKTKKYNNIFLPTYENNENVDNNIDNNNFNNKNNNDEKNTLLAIFKKEKEIKNKLQKILTTNPSVSQNDFFANEANRNKFYNYNSNSKYLSMAKNILINKLTNGEKNFITELDQEINKVKSQISEVVSEKNFLTEKISEKRKELENFLEKKDKIEFEFERDLINDLRSILNKFKIEIYKKELTLDKKKEEKNEENKEEVEKLKKEYKLKKNDLDLFNKNCEKNIIEIQKQIMIKHYENEKMKEKIEIYEQDNQIDNLEQELPEVANKKLINLNNKRENKIKLINNEEKEDDDNDIIINNNYVVNNIIKTRAKSNHINNLDFEFPDKYFDEKNKDNKIVKHQFELDGKNIIIYNSGKKEVIFPNKTRKEIFPDGYTLVTYSNGDIKEIIPNYREIYYYKKAEVNQITFEDGCKYIKYLKTGKIICNGKAIN